MAVGTGLGAAFLRTSHQRGVELRGRMLDAADEFSTRVVVALQDARKTAIAIAVYPDAGSLIDTEGSWIPAIRSALDEFTLVVNDAQARSSRVQLLFGVEER